MGEFVCGAKNHSKSEMSSNKQTHRHTKYRNPCCACATRVNYIEVSALPFGLVYILRRQSKDALCLVTSERKIHDLYIYALAQQFAFKKRGDPAPFFLDPPLSGRIAVAIEVQACVTAVCDL